MYAAKRHILRYPEAQCWSFLSMMKFNQATNYYILRALKVKE